MAVRNGTSGVDRITGTRGNDEIYGFGGADRLDGAAGNDLIVGGAGGDTMLGGTGNDTFDIAVRSHATGDRITGGAGTDILKINFAGTSAAIDFAAVGVAQTGTFAPNATYTGIERFFVVGSDGNDKIVGGTGSDDLRGGAGNDHIMGVKGNNLLQNDVDTVDGGAGDDLLEFDAATFGRDVVIGGSGNDTLRLHWWDGVTFTVAAQGATVLKDGTNISGVENFHIETDWSNARITTRGGTDHISSGLNDVINTGAGNDHIEAWHGSDRINAGSGNDLVDIRYDGVDVVNGGTGRDTLKVDAGVTYRDENDELMAPLGRLTFNAAGDAATLGGGRSVAKYDSFEIFEVTGGNANDSIRVVGNLDLTARGGAGNDTLRGGTADDTLRGGAGNDVISGGGGEDVMYGDAGNDTITLVRNGDAIGGIGIDRVVVDYRAGTTALDFAFVNSATKYTYTDAVTGFRQFESMHVLGTAFGDEVVGGNGADRLEGRAGNDTLSGGNGVDTLAGGLGADTFSYTRLYASAASDTITDFTAGTDKLEFTRAALDLAAGATPLVTLGTKAVGSSAQFIFNQATEHLFYDADGTGTGRAVDIAKLTGVDSLSTSDFLFA